MKKERKSTPRLLIEAADCEIVTSDGSKIPGYETEIWWGNALKVAAGTNGYHGGDASHGGRTYISIIDLGGSCIDIDLIAAESNHGEGVAITLKGDSELDTIIEALKFAYKTIEKQCKEIGDRHQERSKNEKDKMD